jgi:hypothetical protein
VKELSLHDEVVSSTTLDVCGTTLGYVWYGFINNSYLFVKLSFFFQNSFMGKAHFFALTKK